MAATEVGKPNLDAECRTVLRTWEDPLKDEPRGTCLSREHALLWTPALEVAARCSNLAVGARRDERGQVSEEWLPVKSTRTISHFATWENGVTAKRVLESLLRTPEALARIVDAGSAPIAELIGRRLVSG